MPFAQRNSGHGVFQHSGCGLAVECDFLHVFFLMSLWGVSFLVVIKMRFENKLFLEGFQMIYDFSEACTFKAPWPSFVNLMIASWCEKQIESKWQWRQCISLYTSQNNGVITPCGIYDKLLHTLFLTMLCSQTSWMMWNFLYIPENKFWKKVIRLWNYNYQIWNVSNIVFRFSLNVIQLMFNSQTASEAFVLNFAIICLKKFWVFIEKKG